MQSPLQPSYQKFVPPPPAPPAGPFQMAYNSVNGTYYCTLPPPNHSHLLQYQHHGQHSLWDDVFDHYSSVPMSTHSRYRDTQLAMEPTQHGYQLQEEPAPASFSPGEQTDAIITSRTVFGHSPATSTNPSYSWQAPSSHNEGMNDQEGPLVDRHSARPRGRKRHQRSHNGHENTQGRTDCEAHQRIRPATPNRSSSRAVSPRRDSRPPAEGFLQSAKRMSIGFLTSSFKSDRDDGGKIDTNRYNGQDRMASSTGGKTQERRRVSRPATSSARALRRAPGSVNHTAKHTRPSRRPLRGTSPQVLRHNHQALPRDYITEQASTVPTSAPEDTNGASPQSRSDLSDLGRDLQTSKMNGYLDIWDSTGDPDWERETFALCGLEHCHHCGKYYVLMKTLRHICRR